MTGKKALGALEYPDQANDLCPHILPAAPEIPANLNWYLKMRPAIFTPKRQNCNLR